MTMMTLEPVDALDPELERALASGLDPSRWSAAASGAMEALGSGVDAGQVLALRLGPSFERAQRLADGLARRLGALLDVYGDGVLWSPLQVRPEAHPERTHGVGPNPLHIDYIDRSRPPRLIFLLCQRRDPYGGGQTVLAPFAPSVAALRPAQRELLSQPLCRYWTDQDARQVGRSLPCFPVLDGPWTRFSAKMIPHVQDDDAVLTPEGRALHAPLRAALQALYEALRARQRVWWLAPADLVVFDQRAWAHGRLALGPGQADLPAEQRRLLWQAYGSPTGPKAPLQDQEPDKLVTRTTAEREGAAHEP